MIGCMALVLALVLMIISFWQRRVWLFLLCGMSWFILGAYGFIYRAEGDLFLYIGWIGVAGAVVTFMAPLWLRPRREPAPLEPTRRQLYEERVDKELESVRRKEL